MIPFEFFRGRLVADPELRFTNTNRPVVTFRIANSDAKKVGENQWETTNQIFLCCSMWDAKAEAANTALSKGMEVVVFGKLITHEYQAKDGTNRSSTEVKAQDVFTIVKPASGQQSQPQGQQQGGWGNSGATSGAGNSWTPQGADSGEPPF